MSFRWENIGVKAGLPAGIRQSDVDERYSKTGTAITVPLGTTVFTVPKGTEKLYVKFDYYKEKSDYFEFTVNGHGFTSGYNTHFDGEKIGGAYFGGNFHSMLFRLTIKNGNIVFDLWDNGSKRANTWETKSDTPLSLDGPVTFGFDTTKHNQAYLSNIIISDSPIALDDMAKAQSDNGGGDSPSSSTYITEDEIPKYCGLAADVTMTQVEAASALIDAYKGMPLGVREHAERVNLRHKLRDTEVRGKLVHFPRVEIESVVAKTLTPFGKTETSFDAECLEFDSDESVYFSFYMPPSAMFRSEPKSLIVKYKSGYTEIPEEIKRACGILACNIKSMGGVLRWKSRDDYDIKVTLGNEGVMSAEVKQILDGVEVR